MPKPSPSSQRTIERALDRVGDRQRLAELLGVDLADLNRWILGKDSPPHDVFIRALDLGIQERSADRERPSRKRS